MRELIYVPVIHMSADLGSVAKHLDNRGVANLGEQFWRKHTETISGFWDSVANYFSGLPVENAKIYQDALVIGGDVGLRIIEEGAKAGSKNYELIADLVKGSAILVRTEDLTLVREERDRIVKLTNASTLTEKLIAYLKYRLTRNKLLKKRDNYIAKRIDETLNHDETGIIFMGAYHDIVPKLAKDIEVTEVKDVKKIRDYQRLLLRIRKKKEGLEDLAKYLVSPVNQ